MHLARAVKTRSVIIYGGRIKAWQSGYPCNENIETNPPCSPCWQNNNCDYDQKCMSDISVKDVLDGVSRLELRLDDNFETIKVTLDEHSKN
jgi:ADP-heptose:LPS heptosyltransferase